MSDLHCLYRFYNDAGQLLYVGLTCNPGNRIKQHRRDKPWWREVARMEVEHCPSRSALVEAERHAIEQERPLHNVQGLKVPANKPALAARPGPSTQPPPRRRRPHPFDRWLAPPLTRLDLRVLLYLVRRWRRGDQAQPRVEFTFVELGQHVYGREISREGCAALKSSMDRLLAVRSVGDRMRWRFLSDWWQRDEQHCGTHLTEYTLAWARGEQPLGFEDFDLTDVDEVLSLARQAALVGEEHHTSDPDSPSRGPVAGLSHGWDRPTIMSAANDER